MFLRTPFLKRFYSKVSHGFLLEPLKQRSLVRVAGPEAKDFLQGLITNDINHLNQSVAGSMYSMFLNTKGRVLFDTIIYRIPDSSEYLIECDKNGAALLTKHLKLYRVRRKVDINTLGDDYEMYVLFNNDRNGKRLESIVKDVFPNALGSVINFKNLLIFKDPRVSELGFRVLTTLQTDVRNELNDVINLKTPTESYKQFRYSLGVGEGPEDLPQGNCFPLESNCDYLHGVSFHKGCYIGQELTARTHHTGVVRKRLMPLEFIKTPTQSLKDNTILHEGKNLGKLRGVEGTLGLALLRFDQALSFGEISVGDGVAKVKRPHWWPVEVTKEKANVQKS